MPESDAQASSPAPSAPGQPTISPNGDGRFEEPERMETARTPREPRQSLQPEPVLKQELRGTHIGDRYVRVCRVETQGSEHTASGDLRATEDGLAPCGRFGRWAGKVK